MKLCRIGNEGTEVPALIDADGRIRSLGGIVKEFDEAFFAQGGLERVAGLDVAGLEEVAAGGRMGACIGPLGKIVCIGLNYRDHAAESGWPLPTEPTIFLKGCRVSGPDDAIAMPVGATKLDWEAELGIVIGKRAYGVSEDAALAHVAGFCIVDDVSERAFQHERGGQWVKGKSAAGFAPTGPWLVTRDEVVDCQSLAMELKVNGIVRQHGSTADMVFGVKEIVSYVSQFMVLYPGDLISTGTPAGVGAGQKPTPTFLEIGDEIELTISGLGTQRHTIIAPA